MKSGYTILVKSTFGIGVFVKPVDSFIFYD